MGMSTAPRPKASKPLMALFADQATQPRRLIVHSVTEEASKWFETECKEFGDLAYGGEGNYLLIVKVNFDVHEVMAFINAFRPAPRVDLNPAWTAHIDQLDW